MAAERSVHQRHGSCGGYQPYSGHVHLQKRPVNELASLMAHERVVEDAESEGHGAAQHVGADKGGHEHMVEREERLVVPNRQDKVEKPEHCRSIT